MGRAEFDFIADIRRRAGVKPPVMVGIGDDAAVIRSTCAAGEVVTTDMLMEGVDFLYPQTSAWEMGRKALAVNLSDIAAMGAKPTAAFVSVAFPQSRGEAFARDVYAGLETLAAEYDVTIAGGDTNSWDGPFVINITVIGEPLGSAAILRSGAKPGDVILVTGSFGGSIRGRHLHFTPRLSEARRLLELITPHAMIDVSDGLAADLHHLLEESHVGAIIDASAIPIHPDAHAMADDVPALRHALGDGEDFELILAVSSEEASRLAAVWDMTTSLTRIGHITADRTVLLRGTDGNTATLPPWGWTHEWTASSK